MPIAPPQVQPPASPAPGTGGPPDMTALYTKLLDQQRQDKYIDKGAALIAAGFAQPANRAAILNSVGGGGGGGDSSPGSTLQTLMSLQKDQQAKALRAQQMARLPSIAKKYGLDMDTVSYLFETGKLDETINTMAQPDIVVEKRADGSTYLLDKRKGETLKELSPPDKYQGYTSDLKELDRVNAERTARGEPTIPAETWLTQSQSNRANKTSIDLGSKLEVKAGENKLKALDDAANDVDNGIKTINRVQAALEPLDRGIISGNILAPVAVEARKLMASAFGFSDEAANNTEQFMAQMKEVVLPRVKMLGSGNGITDADREFVEKAVGATNKIDASTIREILRILEKGERNNAARYHKEVDDFSKIDESAAKASRYARKFSLPAPRLKPETIKAFKTDLQAADDAGKKKIIKEFDDDFGAGAHSYFME